VPDPSGDGRLAPEDAEAAWLTCRNAARAELGREPLGRRVYRLEYRHNGRSRRAVVGDPEPQGDVGLVTAIIAFPGAFGAAEADCYSIRRSAHGELEDGEPIIVGCEALSTVEDFA
jgi:hypothetical protein